jgi:hypothetical protein
VIALMLADNVPTRVSGVFFFACNMDPSGVKGNFEFTPVLSAAWGGTSKTTNSSRPRQTSSTHFPRRSA